MGTIPAEIALLTALVRLELQSNRITGTLPTSIGRASGLTYLNVNGNSLVGVVPDGIGALSSMRYLNLGGSFPRIAAVYSVSHVPSVVSEYRE